MTLEEFLAYDDGTESRYGLTNGELVELPPESEFNVRIASFLFAFFLRQNIPNYPSRLMLPQLVGQLPRKAFQTPNRV
jgi:Uma2 family endonuclease